MQVQFRGEWLIRQCDNPACGWGPLRVRRDPNHADTWWVGPLEGRSTWREAAPEPCCPKCGGDLRSAANAGRAEGSDDRSRVA